MEAFFWSAVIRFVIRFMPFRVLKRLVGYSGESGHSLQDKSGKEVESRRMRKPAPGASEEKDTTVRDIIQAVRSVSRYTPWESKCLVRACVARRMLNKAGIPSELCLGVLNPSVAERAETSPGGMRPHAWLNVYDNVVMGGESLDRYVEVSRFR